MRILLSLVAFLSGAALAAQVGFNNGLRVRMGHPILAALTSFLIGTVTLLVYVAVIRPARPATAELAQAPWWVWMGGIVGAVYVASSAAFATRLGAAAWLGLIVTGQVVASLVLDHYGLIGFAPRPINGPRLLGAALLLAGVILILRR